MHIPASHYRSEFLSCSQLVRLDYAQGRDGFEPTLLIKSSTVLLKHIVVGVRMQLVFARLNDRLLYGLKVYDDVDKAAVIWSTLERDQEKQAITALLSGKVCQIFLFNEIAVNVAWAALSVEFARCQLEEIVASAAIGNVDYPALQDDASLVFDRLHCESALSGIIVAEIPGTKAIIYLT